MRNKISAIVFSLALVLGFLSAPALAAFSPRIADSIESVTDGEDFQNYLDSGNASDWYVMAKTRRGAVADYGKYASGLREALEQSGANAVSRQRMALALIMTDGDLMTAGKVLSETTGKQGVMSFIFALHLINNGAKAEGITAGGVADALASLVLESGGWAVSGNNSDVDVTAMALQALAPYADEYAGIVDRALEFLASKQLDDGDYRSYGVANPESGAQVIIALTALGIDPLEDSRFVKNGNTLLDGMMKYAVSGGFPHTYDGEVNKLAPQQIYCALVALERFYDGKSGFYDINNDVSVDESSALSVDESAEESFESSEPTESTREIVSAVSHLPAEPQKNTVSYRIVLTVIIGAAALAVTVMFAIRKRRLSDIVIVIVVGAVLIAAVWLVRIEGADSHYGETSKGEAVGSVTLSVECEAAGKTFFPSAPVDIHDGDTAFDVLLRIANENRIAVAYSRPYGDVYVSAIGGVSEFDYGATSGWMYSVNGVSPSVSASAYTLKSGDVLVWYYVTDPKTE